MAIEPVYKIVKENVSSICENPANPRTITPQKFEQLVQSVKDAPWMLKLRPIVVNKDGIILGGNMRYRACCAAGMESVWVIWADQIQDEQARRFILRDNIDFGKWDVELLRKQYTPDELLKYGAEIELLERKAPEADPSIKPPPVMGDDDAVEPDIDDDELEESKKNFNDNTIKQIVFQLPSDVYEDTIKTMDEISKKLDLNDNSEVLMHLINYYEVSHGLENADNDSIEGESREDEDG
jgi:hypothetical protein